MLAVQSLFPKIGFPARLAAIIPSHRIHAVKFNAGNYGFRTTLHFRRDVHGGYSITN